MYGRFPDERRAICEGHAAPRLWESRGREIQADAKRRLSGAGSNEAIVPDPAATFGGRPSRIRKRSRKTSCPDPKDVPTDVKTAVLALHRRAAERELQQIHATTDIENLTPEQVQRIRELGAIIEERWGAEWGG